MIQMDIPAAYVCAQIFAYSGRYWLMRKAPSWCGKYTTLATTYALGIIGACGIYLYSGWPEWEMMYWFKSIRMEKSNFGDPFLALVAPCFLLVLGLAGAVGFMSAHHWIVENKPKKVLISLCLGIAVSLIMVFITPSAPMLVGHYENYHNFINEAVVSEYPWNYGLILIGSWKICIPWGVADEFLAKHHLITFFNSHFFVPWLIDILIFFVSAFAMAKWFKRHTPD